MIFTPSRAVCVAAFLTLCASASTDWDYLIFSQKWPVTFCIQQTDNESECLYPKIGKWQWTIHGIWPNKRNEKGPFYCNSSVPFDAAKIADIRTKLEKFWPNLESGKSEDSLWQHEWEKHGTCALDLDALSGEKKYFEAGLNLYAEYNASHVFGSVAVYPDAKKGYSAEHVAAELNKKMAVTARLECAKKRHTNKFYLSELRLCFDKKFRPIDCENDDSTGDVGHGTGNCPTDGPVFYPKEADDVESTVGRS